jgi:hypothetical protein
VRIGVKRVKPAQAALLRCVCGNPFRCVKLDAALLTPTVSSLAAAAYAERSLPSGELDAARLAILPDALEEAGCTDASLFAHLRDRGTVHIRGCWCVDLVLGRQ